MAHAMKQMADRIPDTGCEFFVSEVFRTEQRNVRAGYSKSSVWCLRSLFAT